MAVIGFLGLGSMGLPMAKRLLGAGHSLKIAVHTNRAPADALAGLGAVVVESPVEVATGVEYLIAILPADPQIREVLLAPAMVAAVDPKCILLEMSTAMSSTVKEVAQLYGEKGVRVLDAPVSGGVTGAENGTLTIMCGGEASVFEQSLPVLEAMGTKVRLVGGMGAGKDVKAVNQIIGAANTVIVAEGLELARKLGLDLDTVYDIVSSSSGQSSNFDIRFKRMVEERFGGGFKTSLMMKDMRIALAAAGDTPMPMSALAYQLFAMTDEKDRDLDFAAITRVYSRPS